MINSGKCSQFATFVLVFLNETRPNMIYKLFFTFVNNGTDRAFGLGALSRLDPVKPYDMNAALSFLGEWVSRE